MTGPIVPKDIQGEPTSVDGVTLHGTEAELKAGRDLASLSAEPLTDLPPETLIRGGALEKPTELERKQVWAKNAAIETKMHKLLLGENPSIATIIGIKVIQELTHTVSVPSRLIQALKDRIFS